MACETGRCRPIPEDLLSRDAEKNPQTSSMILQGDVMERLSLYRRTARDAFAQVMDDKSLRVAQESRPRPFRGFGKGMLVAFWRKQKAGQSVGKGR